MEIERVYIGGWFQRTMLHLSEAYDFLKGEMPPFDFNKKKLRMLHSELDIRAVTFVVEDFDHVTIVTKHGITVNMFEDGLIVLHTEAQNKNLEKTIELLTEYYEAKLSPALSYIYSLGAPIPKELANIKTIYPYFTVLKKATRQEIQRLLNKFNEEEHFEIKKKTFEIYRGNILYLINNLSENLESLEMFIREQIFIREFKGQMHRYLNLHRIIWEKIAKVKEAGNITGKEVGPFKKEIESYAKTINLIEARMNQMGSYIKTREAIAKNDSRMGQFLDVLQFKHEALSDTLSYMKDIWKMTSNYVNSALDLFTAIQGKATEASVTNLTIITSMGVGATLIGLFGKSKPEFTVFGVFYFFILAVVGYAANKSMSYIAKNRKYKIDDVKIAKDIQ